MLFAGECYTLMMYMNFISSKRLAKQCFSPCSNNWTAHLFLRLSLTRRVTRIKYSPVVVNELDKSRQ